MSENQDSLPLNTIGDYKALSLLAIGGQAQVYLSQKDNKKYAIKVFRPTGDFQKAFLKEVSILDSLVGTNSIVRIVHYSENASLNFDDGSIGRAPIIVMENASKGDLFEFIEQRKGFNQKICRSIFLNILSIIQDIYQKGVLHRDIKPENILIADDYSLQICDFGLSQAVNLKDKSRVKKNFGTDGFRPPEVEIGKYQGECSQVFSLGVLLFNLYTGSLPFISAKYTNLIYRSIAKKEYDKFWLIQEKSQQKKYFSESFKQLINSLLSFNPTERPKLDKICSFEWFREESATQLELKQELQNVFSEILRRNPQRKKIQQIILTGQSKNAQVNNSFLMTGPQQFRGQL